jgi:hypothetical protein
MIKFLTFLKNNALILFLAIVPPIGIWWFTQRDVKELSVRVVANVPIVTVDRNLAEGVEVSFRGTPVTTLRAVELVVRNAGNKPMPKTDFDMPLTFTFAGQLVGTPSIIRRSPPQLPIELKGTSMTSMQLAPLLLNPSDEFSFRVLVANAAEAQPQVTVMGRVVGVSDIIVEYNAANLDAKIGAINWLELILVVIGLVVSLISVFQLLRKGYEIRLATEGASLAIRLVKRIDPGIVSTSRVESLANELGIKQHDFKSNIFLLRLKIENQLRDLARQSGLSDRELMAPLSSLARSLGRHGVLPEETVELAAALSRPMNRELHELYPYLSDAEFESLQRSALELVAILDQLHPSRRAPASSTACP